MVNNKHSSTFDSTQEEETYSMVTTVSGLRSSVCVYNKRWPTFMLFVLVMGLDSSIGIIGLALILGHDFISQEITEDPDLRF